MPGTTLSSLHDPSLEYTQMFHEEGTTFIIDGEIEVQDELD